jgi:hypothetical protein
MHLVGFNVLHFTLFFDGLTVTGFCETYEFGLHVVVGKPGLLVGDALGGDDDGGADVVGT